MVRAGDPIARFAVSATGNLFRVLSASQLGITLSSLGLGWVAEEQLGSLFESFFAQLPLAIEHSLRLSLGATVALSTLTYFHVVFGELVPRGTALNHPEQVAKWLAPPLLAFAWLVSPFTMVLNRSASLVLRLFGQPSEISHESVHSPDELRMLVEQSERLGSLQTQDAELLGGVFEFSEKNAREVMTPRTDIVALPVEATLDEAATVVDEAGFSRYPVYEESLDNVIGMVHAKDLLRALHRRTPGAAPFSLRTVMRSIHVVPGSREVEEVLADFKQLKEHMAIVLDEYGGTAGLVTMEDLLEEIVGEILDEYDDTIDLPVTRVGSGETLVPGSTSIRDLNDEYELAVPDEDYTTIGGYVFGALGRLPVVGDRVSGGGAVFAVRAMDGRRIETLSLEREKSE